MKKPSIATSTAVPLLSAGLLAGVLLAPAAHAITNPAENPHPIVVKGDDGKTYEDGRDTLPGYDDIECSYIPGAWFDFDNNRVHYADGQSIPWTEWDRIAGYKEWLEKQKGKESPAPGKSGGSSGSSGGSSGKTGGSGSSGSSSGKTGSSGSSGGGSASQGAPAGGSTGSGTSANPSGTTPSEEAVDGAASVPGAEGSGTKKKHAERKKKDEATDTETVEGTFVAADRDAEDAEDDEVAQAAGGGQSGSGLLILGGLLAAGLALVGGYGFIGRLRRKRAA